MISVIRSAVDITFFDQLKSMARSWTKC